MKDGIVYYRERSKAIIFLMAGFVFFSCSNRKEDAVNPEAIYFDYKITGTEGDDNLTVMLQYRDGGEEGDAIATGKVTLDGEVLTADSTKMSGIFYELHKPIAEFAGKHIISFIGIDKKEYREEFSFEPLVLLSTLPDTIMRNGLVFEFAGIGLQDQLRVILTDTTLKNDGDFVTGLPISADTTVPIPIQFRLAVDSSYLFKLFTGPIQLEFIKETIKDIEGFSRRGGRLLITYSLKREFILKD